MAGVRVGSAGWSLPLAVQPAFAPGASHLARYASRFGITEINSGIYLFRAADLAEALGGLDNDNAQREYYLTDVFGWFRHAGRPIAAHASADAGEVQGINTVEQLADADAEFARRTSMIERSQG